MPLRKVSARFVDTCGRLGAIALLSAYGATSLSLIKPGVLYQCVNLLGATAVGWSALRKHSYQAAFVEFAWAAIACAALVRLAVGAI